MTRFVHLRAHTEYSVVDGVLRVDDYAQGAADDGQGAAAITDLNNLFAAVKFYGACRKRGVKPILGAEVTMAPWRDRCGPSRLVLLAQNAQGWRNLCELLSRGWLEGVKSARDTQAVIDWAWLASHGEGLIVLSGAHEGAVGQLLLADRTEDARKTALELQALFPQRFYLEVQRADRPFDEPHVRACAALAAQTGLPLVATQPIQFLAPTDFAAHEARVCIAQAQTLADPKRPRAFTREQHFKTAEEMGELFADLPSALSNAVRIAQRCNVSLVLGKPQLPDFPTPVRADGTPTPLPDYFRQASHEGLVQRLALLYPDEGERERQRPRYVQRLDFEIETILKMGFPGYFLIVADFINWAKANGCPVGPGRGSGAGSLVAYSLKITDLDPLAYKLLFERFLNPDRVSMPDFDVDFCQANRDRVIEYVKDKYGREAVSQIATFGTMAAKAALRDVGRVMGLGYGQVDAIAKLVPAPPGKTVTLAQVPAQPEAGVVYARREAPELERREAADEEVAMLLGMAAQMEGTVRNIGMHAGGVLIAPERITDFCPLYQPPGSDAAVSQFDKDDVESAGLVKFDFLGLATLTILEHARRFISRRHPRERNFSYETLALDDPQVYDLFCAGRTEAVFQFESRGMQSLLREAKPSRLEDLIALNALYRPGPMDLIPTFVARKHGREVVEYPHPLCEAVLSETYGIMVYQEQVMQTAQILGGYSLGAADLLRRAMGKKKPEEMAKQRVTFREGAARNGITEQRADEIFDLMEKFAGYGFNKSHAAAYSLLAYHTAYIKVHFPAEFFAANLTVEQGDTDKLQVLMAEAERFDVVIERPDINTSSAHFEPVGSVDERRIRYSLAAIKGTGAAAIEAIVAARDAGGPFADLFDFCRRVGRGRVNKRVVEALIKAGAFDDLHPQRAQAMAGVEMALRWAETCETSATQGGLFDDGPLAQAPCALPSAKPWSVRDRLEHERSALGFFLSGHLLDEHEHEVRRFAPVRVGDLARTDGPVTVCGSVSAIKLFDGPQGRSAVVTIYDRSGAMDLSVGQDLLSRAPRELLQVDAIVVASGRLSADRFSGGFRLLAKDLMSLDGARRQHAQHIVLDVSAAGERAPALLQELRDQARARDREPAARRPDGHARGADGAPRVPVRLRVRSASGDALLTLDGLFVEATQEQLAHWSGMGAKPEVVYRASIRR